MRRVAALVAATALWSCQDGAPASTDAGAASASAPMPSASTRAPVPAGPAAETRLQAILKAEVTRRAEAITAADQSHRDVRVRRAAARALARIRGAATHGPLLRGLADEDDRVVAWSAYGLGDACVGARGATIDALIATATARVARQATAKPEAITALDAIARAIGRCGPADAEALLTDWASRPGPLRGSALRALGDLATSRKRLREDTYVVLLRLASGDAKHKPLTAALYPIGRVQNVPPSVTARLRDVATARLAEPGPDRVSAVRALARADDAAVPKLREVLEKHGDFRPEERAEAARGLGRFGKAGQKALLGALATLVPEPKPGPALEGAHFGAALAALETLDGVGKARPLILRIAKLAPPEGAPEALQRRLSWLRCRAALLVFERNYTADELVGCDLLAKKGDTGRVEGRVGAAAMVESIGIEGTKIRGKRFAAWKLYATGGDVRARQAAIGQLADHAEIREPGEIIAKALSDPGAGVIDAAASLVAKHPERVIVGRKKPKPHPLVASALQAALDGKGGAADLETRATVIDAVAAVGLVEALPSVKKLCASPWAKLREHAAKALPKLGAPKTTRCPAPAAGLPPPPELDHLVTKPTKIAFDSPAGALSITLAPDHAPVAATRVVDLVKKGYYEGMIVHRVVPGFVSQFGSPSADGYGGAPGLPAMPCETSPVAFAPHTVGVALSGRDTGSSQLFVTHTAFPHLDGKYAWIGQAEGPWDALVDGDALKRVRVAD